MPRPSLLWRLVSHHSNLAAAPLLPPYAIQCHSSTLPGFPVYNPLIGIISYYILMMPASCGILKTPVGAVGIMGHWNSSPPQVSVNFLMPLGTHRRATERDNNVGPTSEYTGSREHVEKHFPFLVIYALLSLCKGYIVYRNWLLLISRISNFIKLTILI